jgi:hypothetical protein
VWEGRTPLDAVNGSAGYGRPSGLPVGVLFREVNDRIRELAGRFGGDEAGLFVCECDEGECFASIALTMREYDAVRRLNPGAALLAHDRGGRAFRQGDS